MRLFSPEVAYEFFVKKNELYSSYGYHILDERINFLQWLETLKEPILELGSGRGYFTFCLAKKFKRVICLDMDLSMIEFSQAFLEAQGIYNVDFVKGSAQDLPFMDNEIGSIVCFNAWHHFEHIDSIIREMLRVIMPNGVIAVADFSEEGFALVEEVHIKLYNQSHQVANMTFDKLKQISSIGEPYYYRSKYQKGICLRVKK